MIEKIVAKKGSMLVVEVVDYGKISAEEISKVSEIFNRFSKEFNDANLSPIIVSDSFKLTIIEPED